MCVLLLTDAPAIEQQKKRTQDLQPRPQPAIGYAPRVSYAVFALDFLESLAVIAIALLLTTNTVILRHVCLLLTLPDRSISYG